MAIPKVIPLRDTSIGSRRGIRSRNERGAELIEYVLMVLLVILVGMIAVKFFGQRASAQYSNIVTTVDEVM